MTKNFSCELTKLFNEFNKNCKYLKRLFKETKYSQDEIEKSGYFDNRQLSKIKIPCVDEDFIQKIIDQHLGIIILGQNCWAKASVVNELFGQSLLPTLPPNHNIEEEQCSWRMVRLSYGVQTKISLALSNNYELVENLVEQPWHTVPRANLEVRKDHKENPELNTAVLEISLNHHLLWNDVEVIVSPSNHNNQFSQMYNRCIEGLTPIVIYCIKDNSLTEKEQDDLMALRKIAPAQPVYFVCSRPLPTCELTESEQHDRGTVVSCYSRPLQLFSYKEFSQIEHYQKLHNQREPESQISNTKSSLFQQLYGLGFSVLCQSNQKKSIQRQRSEPYEVGSELSESFDKFPSILLLVQRVLQSFLVKACTVLNEACNRCLRMFILTAFDMTRDMVITPRRLEYICQRETELYTSLMTTVNTKQEEIRQLIISTIIGMKSDLLEEVANHQFQGLNLPEKGELLSLQDLHICTIQIQNLVLSRLSNAIAGKLIGSVDCLRESFVGTLVRCLSNLEKAFSELEESVPASSALKQILNAAYQVDLTVKTSTSVLAVFLEKIKQLLQNLFWKPPPRIDGAWKRRVAGDMLASLNESRLASSICTQIQDQLKASHKQFATSLQQLESMHLARLKCTKEQRLKVRKIYAPKIAMCALESTSLRDMVLFGVPKLEREIGRGQYGVVYSCESWNGFSPCAVKSVVPPDDKHWNDLAMEFFYTRSIAEHERIVQIQGSVIDYSYGGGNTPAVLLIMERLQRDLHSAIKAGLDFNTRLKIALDVIQGIRFLHSQGLVHRDIKLKNLDNKNRAKITDLGFCKPEAMMSGSIVGTPIHMAPELFSGQYDNSVDVYAFGILFWYLCAGHVQLPCAYEQCQTKDQLWNCVRKGSRPERLPQFDNECWELMEECWAGDPSKRPLLGNVEPRLVAVMQRYRSSPKTCPRLKQEEVFHHLSSDPFTMLEFYSG
ncbi:dual serine/threonine and tyrosine protein kinase-like isoform X2 [Tachypleus tridentatus]|uniref:dual serine/threonine and tyrosine protein kinase-like isoform X2 n=1 Tax=Tachypleus tridentatus TaxID=6853 RepID=UPI003FD0BD3C